MTYFSQIDLANAERRRVEIRDTYGITGVSLNRIFSFYKNSPSLLGQVEDTIEYMIETFKVYGKTQQEAIDFINANHNIAVVKSDILNKKLAILYNAGMDEKVLFEKPSILQSGKIIDLYTSLEDIKANQKEMTIQALGSYQFENDESKLKLKKKYPLYQSKYDQILDQYEKFRASEIEENKKLILE